jgi:hypothetical protein
VGEMWDSAGHFTQDDCGRVQFANDGTHMLMIAIESAYDSYSLSVVISRLNLLIMLLQAILSRLNLVHS